VTVCVIRTTSEEVGSLAGLQVAELDHAPLVALTIVGAAAKFGM
jgi:hypothetical protein